MPELPGKNCCGCAACAQKCPHHALQMEADDFGFFIRRLTKSCAATTEFAKKSVPF